MNRSMIAVTILSMVIASPSCEIVSDALVSVNLDVVKECAAVSNTTGVFDETSGPFSIESLIGEGYSEVKNFRIYDIVVYVTGPAPTGQVQGTVYYELEMSGQFIALATFNAAYSDLQNGVSLLQPGGAIALASPSALSNLLRLLNLSPPPSTIRVRVQGTTATPLQNGVQVCGEVYFQADAEV